MPNDSQLEKQLAGEVLQLRIEDTREPIDITLKRVLCKNEIWHLWLDEAGNFVFTQPKQKPQRWIIIDPDFQQGRIVGNFTEFNQRGVYPLQYIDIVIYSNWLANSGDLILHASGIAYGEEGYCFLGDSGTGKSTLVRDLAGSAGVTVLGEDQIILRKMDEQFFVFGTPWHETPEMCSPRGVPLKKIFFLDRNAPQTIDSVRDFDAVVNIMRTAFYPIYRPEAVEKILARLSSLPGAVGFYTLAYERGSNVLGTIVKP